MINELSVVGSRSIPQVNVVATVMSIHFVIRLIFEDIIFDKIINHFILPCSLELFLTLSHVPFNPLYSRIYTILEKSTVELILPRHHVVAPEQFLILAPLRSQSHTLFPPHRLPCLIYLLKTVSWASVGFYCGGFLIGYG